MKFQVSLTNIDLQTLATCAQKPELHVWACNEESKSTFHIVPVTRDFKFTRDLEVKGSDKTMICVDLYGYEANNRGQLCKLHLGSVTSAVSTDENKLQIKNKNSGVEYTTLLLRSSKDLPHFVFDQKSLAAYAREMIKTGYTVQSSYSACDNFARNVFTPEWQTRVCPLPAQAYFFNMATAVVPTQSFFQDAVNKVMKRMNLTSDKVSRSIKSQFATNSGIVTTDFHNAVALTLEICTYIVNCYPYIQDYYIDPTKGEKIGFESFDHLFVRCAGDCEDSGLGIVQLYSTFQTMFFADQYMRELQSVAKLYVPCAVLGIVNKTAYGYDNNVHQQAHMYSKIIPVVTFMTANGSDDMVDAAEWCKNLYPWLGEGTAPVAVTTSAENNILIASRLDAKIVNARKQYESRHCATNTPTSLKRVYNGGWVQMKDTFYANDLHMYTDYLRRKDISKTCAFAVINTDTNEYGAPVQAVLNNRFKLVPEGAISGEDEKLVESVLSFEHPPVKLDKCHVTLDESKYAVFLHDLHESRRADADVYSDYLLQRPSELSKNQWLDVVRFMQKRKEIIEIVREGWDVNSRSLRFRVVDI